MHPNCIITRSLDFQDTDCSQKICVDDAGALRRGFGIVVSGRWHKRCDPGGGGSFGNPDRLYRRWQGRSGSIFILDTQAAGLLLAVDHKGNTLK